MLEFRNRAISTGSRNPEKKNGGERKNRERERDRDREGGANGSGHNDGKERETGRSSEVVSRRWVWGVLE